MKKTVYTLLFSLLFTGILGAQMVQEGEWMMSLGKQNAFFADMPEVNKDIAEDVWKDYMKDYGKVKRNKKAKEYYSQEANIPIIGGTQPLNVYAKFDERVDMNRTSPGAGIVDGDFRVLLDAGDTGKTQAGRMLGG